MAIEITEQMVFVPADGIEISEIPDGRVIYQSSMERVHYLNPTAVVVFELCAMKRPVAEIVEFLQTAYQLSTPPAAEVHDCITSLLNEQLLQPLGIAIARS